MTRPHRLDIDGEPWDGTWRCARCLRTFAWFVDSLGSACNARSWPWPADRIAAFRARARHH